MTKKIERILLLTCPIRIPAQAIPRSYPPLGSAYLAACLEEKGYQVKIFDPLIEGFDHTQEFENNMIRYGASPQTIGEEIASFKPDLVGISTLFTGDAIDAHELAGLVKKESKKIITVIGGHYPFSLPQRSLADKNIDYMIMGEGEYALRDLVGFLNGDQTDFPKNQIFTKDTLKNYVAGSFPIVKNLDELPLPARHLLSMEKYFSFMEHKEIYKPLRNPSTTLMATRGCPLVCSFCMHTAMLGHDYEKSKMSTLRKEIEHLVTHYGIKEINFVDENLILDPRYTKTLTDTLKEFDLSWYMMAGTYANSLSEEILEKFKESGCYRLKFNLESTIPETLKSMRKSVNLKKAYKMIQYAKQLGINVSGQFILGYPNETLEQMKESAQWIENADFDYVSFGVAVPYPGTTLYKEVKSAGYLLSEDEEDLFNMYCGSGRIQTPNFKPEQVEELRHTLWKQLNFPDGNSSKKNRVIKYFDPSNKKIPSNLSFLEKND